MDCAFDLLVGSIVSHSLQAASKQDRFISKEAVSEVRRGDLVLREMGYFSLGEFTAIELRKDWQLTRLQLTTGVVLADGRSLDKYLKSFRGDIIDLDAIVGEQDKKCRLGAMRAAMEVSAGRRPERHKKARDRDKNPCPKSLLRDGWHLMLTNLSREQADVRQLARHLPGPSGGGDPVPGMEASAQPRQSPNRKSNEHRLQALVVAGMIAHQLGMMVAPRVGKIVGLARLSYEKLSDLLAVRLIKASDLAELAAFKPDPSHGDRDKQSRKSLVESGIQAST